MTAGRSAGDAREIQVRAVEQVSAIGEAIGRPSRFEEIPPEIAREPEVVTPTVEEVTGAPARTFRQWALDHADDFR